MCALRKRGINMTLKEKHAVFTIGRQYGSGGRQIGKKLAEMLDIPFLDKELLELAAKESGLKKEVFENIDEQPRNFLSNEFILSPFAAISSIPINDTIFTMQADTITKLAQKGSCVIVGRCAGYILKDFENTIDAFIHSTHDDKLERIVNEYGLSEDKAVEMMRKVDKKRQAYHNYYADTKWGMCKNYDISLNTSITGIDGAVQLILSIAEMKFNNIK